MLFAVAPAPESFAEFQDYLRRFPAMRERIRIASPRALSRAIAAADPGGRLSVERAHVSARQTMPRGQAAVVCAMLAAFAGGLLLTPGQVAVGLSVIVTLLGMIPGVARMMAGAAGCRSRLPTRAPPAGPPPFYSVLVPLYREARVAPVLAAALDALDYPRQRLEILFLLEEDDHENPRGPSAAADGAYANRGLAGRRTAHETQGLAHLAIDHGSHRIFARQFRLEYAGLFDCLLPWLSARGWPFPLGGTSNHFRRSALEAVGGWDPYNVTEDADLSLRLSRAGYELQTLASTTFEEAPLNWSAWHKQRTRWLKGWLQTLLVTLRDPLVLAGELRRTKTVVLLVYLVSMVVTLAAHPIFLGVLLAYGSGISPVPFNASWQANVTLSLAGTSVALAYGSMTVLAFAGARARGHWPPFLDLLFIPFYWLAQSLAFYAAVVDLVRRPHSPFRGLSLKDPAVADRFADATRNAFTALVTRTLERKADFLVIAGDIYDGEWQDNSVGLFFNREIARLDRAGVPVFGTRKPESHALEELGVVLHGQSFADRHVADNLARAYPPPVAGKVNIGVLHTSLTGRPPHADYAPCSLEDLTAKGYDYWALGHVHQYEVVNRDPQVVFPGNLQGRNSRETGEKGAVLVTVEDGRVLGLERLIVDEARFERLELDIGACEDLPGLLATVEDGLAPLAQTARGRPVALRLRLHGYSELRAWLLANRSQLADEVQAALDRVGQDVWLEKLVLDVAETPGRAPSPLADSTLDIAALLEGAARDPDLVAAANANLAELGRKIPNGALDPARPFGEDLDTLIQEAKARLHFLRYGNLTDVTFRFRADARLHLVYGPNEAGKSSALAALSDLLFGFSGKRKTADGEDVNRYDFLHPGPSLRVAATLRNRAGETIAFRRRRGNKNTLLADEEAETPLRDDALAPFLGSLTQDVFERSFGLNSQRLQDGARAMISGEGGEDGLLLAAASGLGGLRDLRATLASEADRIFTPRAAKERLFYQALAAYDEARVDERDHRLRASDWKAINEAIAASEAEVDEARTALTELRKRQARLQQLDQFDKLLAEVREHERTLGDFADLDAVATGFGRSLRDRLDARDRARTAHRAATEALQDAERARDGIAPDRALLAKADAVTGLFAQTGAYRERRKDIPRVQAQVDEQTQDLAALLRRLGLGALPTDSESLGARQPSDATLAT
eukprot:jgi/Tetstr1/463862/TSEL_008673.t1